MKTMLIIALFLTVGCEDKELKSELRSIKSDLKALRVECKQRDDKALERAKEACYGQSTGTRIKCLAALER